MHPDPDVAAGQRLYDDLSRSNALVPLWQQRFGREMAEERQAAVRRLFLDLTPEGSIERVLAVNLDVVQAAPGCPPDGALPAPRRCALPRAEGAPPCGGPIGRRGRNGLPAEAGSAPESPAAPP